MLADESLARYGRTERSDRYNVRTDNLYSPLVSRTYAPVAYAVVGSNGPLAARFGAAREGDPA